MRQISYCIDNLFIIYRFPKRNSPLFKRNYAGTFDVSDDMFSNVIGLVLRDSDTDSENASLIRLSVSLLYFPQYRFHQLYRWPS